jgi:glycosyltransferase involved in cell wall biosynthesis
MKEEFSVAMIVRNEEVVLERCLSSLTGIKDIVIVDTGSTDETISIADSFKNTSVIEVSDKFIIQATDKDVSKFKDLYGVTPTFTSESKFFNFSAARNYAASLAVNDFILPVDADEILTIDLDAVQNILPNADKVTFPFIWSHKEDGTPLLSMTSDRLARRSMFKAIKTIHEAFIPVENSRDVSVTCMHMDHWQIEKESRANYLPQLEYSITELPNDLRNTYYLAREYYYYKDWNNAIAIYMNFLACNNIYPPEKAQAQIELSKCYKAIGDINKSEYWLNEATKSDITRREPFVELGNFYYDQGLWQKAIIYYTASLAIPAPPLGSYFLNDMDLYTWKVHDKLSLCYHFSGQKELAIEHWTKAIQYVPEDQRIINNLQYFVAGI